MAQVSRTDESRTQLRTIVTSLAVLWLVVLAPRIFVAARAVAPARDAFRYLAAAQAFERLPWPEAVRAMDVHPLYPLTLLWIRELATWATSWEGPFLWIYAGQCWSICCSLVFLSLAYLAGVGIWNHRIALLGALAISVAPRQVNYAADVLSDSFFAALWMASFAAGVWAWRSGRAMLAVVAGVFAGLAYLTRIEAVLLPMTFAAAWLAGAIVPRWRLSWRRCLLMGSGFAAASAPTLLGYIALTGRISPRQSANAIIGGPTRPEPVVTLDRPLVRFAGKDVTRFRATPTRPEANDSATPESNVRLVDRQFRGMEGYEKPTIGQALIRLFLEVSQETRGWLLALAAVALVDRRRTRCHWPTGLLPVFAILGCGAMLLLLHIKAGFVAGRYMTPVLPLFAMFAMCGAESLVARAAGLRDTIKTTSCHRMSNSQLRVAGTIGAIVITAMILCVPSCFAPLHRHRWGHMQAAQWLRENSRRDDLIFDPNYFSAFFADRTVWLPVGEPPAVLPVRYAVVDVAMIYRTDNTTHQTIAKVNDEGRLVAQFRRQPRDAEVSVYVFEITNSALEDRLRR
jgi:hypothetical protein